MKRVYVINNVVTDFLSLTHSLCLFLISLEVNKTKLIPLVMFTDKPQSTELSILK